MLFGLAWGWSRETAGGLLTLGNLVLYLAVGRALTGRLPPDAPWLALPLAAGAAFLASGLLAPRPPRRRIPEGMNGPSGGLT